MKKHKLLLEVTVLPINITPEMMFGNRDLKNMEFCSGFFLSVKTLSVFNFRYDGNN
jgi:hypothetical protein